MQTGDMDDKSVHSTWLRDESTLADIGAALNQQPTQVEVRLPRSLAGAAVQAWQRNDEDNFDSRGESWDQRVVRHRAGTLALIGAAIEDRGQAEGDDVVVKLDAWFVGDALNAADDAGLIGP